MFDKKTINFILKVGTLDSASVLTNFRVILINSIALLSAGINLFYFVIFFLKLQFPLAVFYFLGGTVSLTCIYLNRLQKSKTASGVLFVVIGLIIILTSLLSGYSTQCHTLLVIVAACVVLVSTSLYFPIIYLSGILLLYSISYYYVDVYGPLMPEIKIPYSDYINFGFAILCSFFFAMVLLKEVVDYIDSLKNTLDLLKNKNDEIKDKNKKLELFNAVAAHDLRTPVRIISSFSGLAKRKLESSTEKLKLREYLNTIENSAKQMNALINSISHMSELNQNQLVEQEQVDLNKLIEDIIQQTIQTTYPNSKIHFKQLPTIFVNKSHINTVFQNLLLNGLKYNHQDQKEMYITSTTNDTHVHFHISDNGIGIEPVYKDMIFEPFAKLHSESQFEGTGMGLFIIKEILKKYGGSVRVQDTSIHGTTFEISLPVSIIVKETNENSQSHLQLPSLAVT